MRYHEYGKRRKKNFRDDFYIVHRYALSLLIISVMITIIIVNNSYCQLYMH